MQQEYAIKIPALLSNHEPEILTAWIKYQIDGTKGRAEFLTESALKAACTEFLNLFQHACKKADLDNLDDQGWHAVKKFLADLSAQRATQGFTPSETAGFVFTLKQPLFDLVLKVYKGEEQVIAMSVLSTILDKLGLFTTEVYQKSREDVIRRQQRDILEMSTPVIKLWENILVVPLIGTLDSARTQTVMEALLDRIQNSGARIAILDITGVPTVDTQTAQHLIKTISAARLMGADCVLSGIRPQIAQTIVHLGIDIEGVTTRANLADAVQECLSRTGWAISRVPEHD